MRKLWEVSGPIVRSSSHWGSRLEGVLTAFHAAWTAKLFEHSILNLAIVLELLFSPVSNSELSHQISFNAAKFVTNDPEERYQIYDLMKRFYSERSRIVHGSGVRVREKGITPTLEAFQLVVKILRKILMSHEWMKTFNNDSLRSELHRSLLFNQPK